MARTLGVIAVVAEDPSRRRGLHRLLRQEQYQVVALADTGAALRRVPDRPYDAALVALTDRAGLAALARIRGQGAAVIALAPAAVIDVVLLTHDQMLRAVWGPGKVDRTVYLRVYVAALRRKLEPDPTAPHYLLTEPGFGYRFRPRGAEG